MVMIDDSTFQAVNNNNLKAIGEQPAVLSNLALRQAVEAAEAISQIGRNQLQAQQQMLLSVQQQHMQAMASYQQLQTQALAGYQMVSLASATKVAEDSRHIDPKDARGEGLLLDPAIYAGRDISGMRTIVREELVAALAALSKVPSAAPAA